MAGGKHNNLIEAATVVVDDSERGWMVEIERHMMTKSIICVRCKGRNTALASQIFAEARLVRLAKEEALRAARIQKRLGAT